MKKFLFSVLMSLMISVPGHAELNLYSPLEQQLPEEVTHDIYRNLEAAMKSNERKDEPGIYSFELQNFNCEIAGYNTANPTYTCSYGLNGEFSGGYARNIYGLLVQAGFISECDDHDGSCDIDPVRKLTCIKKLDWCAGIKVSCSIKI